MPRAWMLLLLGLAAFAVPGAGGTPGASPSGREKWVATDLGTLPGGYRSTAVALNERGQVVGTSNIGGAGQHVFLWQGGAMVDLGAVSKHGGVTGINARGQVVWDGYLQSVMWDKGVVKKLGLEAAAFNDAGQVVGARRQPNGRYVAALWANGRLRDLGTLGGSASEAVAVNNQGLVVGTSGTGTTFRAFLWRNGKMIDLGTLGGANSKGAAINERGEIVGVSETKKGVLHAFRWHHGKMHDLGIWSSWSQHAIAVNERGQVLVNTHVSGSRNGWALWDGTTRMLGTLGGIDTEPEGMNDSGEVVGASRLKPAKPGFAGKYHAFLWQDGTLTDLGRSGSGPSESRAYAINNQHQIVGATETGEIHRAGTPNQTAIQHAILWTPVSG